MKHLLRAAGILVGILFVAFILPKLVPPTTTESLQSYGFYAGRSNAQEWKQVSIQYADKARCSTCHGDKGNTLVASTHKTVSCQSCHGAAAEHIERGIPLAFDSSNQLCETCHAQVVGRPAAFPQVDPAVHAQQATCLTCHNPHAPKLN